ncbi:MAG: hypothetical protein ACK4WM_09200 [Thermoflexales bacterium]
MDKPVVGKRSAPPPTTAKPKKPQITPEMYAAVERGNREQAREAREYELMYGRKKAPKAPKAPPKKYARGGKVSSIDGVARRGHTKAKMVKMARGGRCGMKKGR